MELLADKARKALNELPGRLPRRMRIYMMFRAVGERERAKATRAWLHAIHGDPITGKDKKTIRRELAMKDAPGESADLFGADALMVQDGGMDEDTLKVDAKIENPNRHGMPLTYLDGLSDIELASRSEIARESFVVVRWELTGTHSGELLGVPPTHATVSLSGITSVKFDEAPNPDGGRRMWATDEWTYWDLPSLMAQIGAAT
jgi:hypothetical protein